jgi:hypothetical protein
MDKSLENRLKNNNQEVFKSEGERKIAEFLNNYNIHYIYEKGVLVIDKNKPKIWYPDFYLPEFATYIEYYGLAGNQNYDYSIEHKKKVYSINGVEVISVYPWTFCENWQKYIIDNLYEISSNRLNSLSQKIYKQKFSKQTDRLFNLNRSYGRTPFLKYG